MTTALKISNLSKTYRGKRGRRVEALKDLSLEVHTGEVFGFLGPNGAGKSTTIKILMGLIFPTSGSFVVAGIPGSSPRARATVGYLPENPSFHDYLTGEEYLVFVGRMFGMPEDLIGVESERLLRLLDLQDAGKRPLKSYSKGMLQRLALAQCLIHDPEIYVLDEPMSGLDPLGRMLVRDIILDLKSRGKCVFMSTHILNDVETICDRVGIIVKGRLRVVEELKDLVRKGIRGYQIEFNSVSEEMSGFLRSLNGNASHQGGALTFDVGIEHFDRMVAMLASDGGTSIRLIEPVRRGLEELFREVADDR